MSVEFCEHLPPVVTAEEMAQLDRFTIESVGIPGLVLMENAGRAVVSVARKMLGDVHGKHVLLFCGKGNNGGDGFVVARWLHQLGARVTVLASWEHEKLSGDVRKNAEILNNLGVVALPWAEWEHKERAEGVDLVVDALLGTGVRGALKPDLSVLVEKINAIGAPILAIDLPTGVETDTGRVEGACIRADATVTMACLKRGLLFSPGREHAGRVHVADIGIPVSAAEKFGVKCFQLRENFISEILPRRAPNAFKNRVGQVLVLAGSAGLTGAAALSSQAVLRIGAGMSLLGLPKSLLPIVASRTMEVMTLPLPETASQSLSYDARAAISEKLAWADVLAIGPGLSVHEETRKLVQWLLTKVNKPIVLDADGLNCLQEDVSSLRRAKGELILTPHPGELSRLIKKSSTEIAADPIRVAREAAKDLSAVVVL
ncbi:MAG: NAD(P)H-hydrate epimerase, partial [Calditrichaeota bacterium]